MVQYVALGETELSVSRLAFGTWTFSETNADLPSVYGVGSQLARTLVHAAIDRGINYFDTADQYASGQAESLLGSALGAKRRDVVLSTKVGLRSDGGRLTVDLSRDHVARSIDESLKRLKTDWVDLYVAHAQDESIPLEESLLSLDATVRAGKARYIGFSNWAPWRVAAALEFQRANGLARFTHGQMHYSLAGRGVEGDYLTMSRRYGLGLTVWSPLAMGLLSGKFDRSTINGPGARFSEIGVLDIQRDRAVAAIELLREIGSRQGATVAQLAIAWLLHKPAVTSVILGVSKLAQLEENLGAKADLLTDENVAALDAITAPPPSPYPNEGGLPMARIKARPR